MPPLKTCKVYPDNSCPGAPPPTPAAEKKPYTSTQHAQKLLMNLNTLRNDSRFCDIQLRAGGTIFNAHKAVLSASSAYFEAMFRPGMSEEQKKSVTLHTLDPDILNLLIDFIYTGRVEISQSNVQELLSAADMLQLQEVVTGCTDFLQLEIHPSNALGILRFAEAHHCTDLVRYANDFVNINFPQVSKEDELLDLPMNLLTRLLSSEQIRVDSEYQVFEAALRWVSYDAPRRRRHVFEVLRHVRFSLMPLQLLQRALDECRDDSLKVALRSIVKDLVSRRGLFVPLSVAPRQCAKKHIYIIGGSKRETTSGWHKNTDAIFESVAKYDTFRGEWLESPPMAIGRILPGVASLRNRIYVVGGELGSQILANGEVFDTQTESWSHMAPMVIPRCEFGLCALNNSLWAIGGWVGEDIGGSIERYDPFSDEWLLCGDMPEPRFSMGVVTFEGLIYIVGGSTNSRRHLPDLISFNPVTGEWTKLPSMSKARSQMGVAVLDRCLYVVGGNGSHSEVLRTVEKYDFDKGTWTNIAPMCVCRASPAVASANGLLYVAGGDQTIEVNFYRAQITITSMEAYDPLTDQWMDCPELPESRSEAGAVVL